MATLTLPPDLLIWKRCEFFGRLVIFYVPFGCNVGKVISKIIFCWGQFTCAVRASFAINCSVKDRSLPLCPASLHHQTFAFESTVKSSGRFPLFFAGCHSAANSGISNTYFFPSGNSGNRSFYRLLIRRQSQTRLPAILLAIQRIGTNAFVINGW